MSKLQVNDIVDKDDVSAPGFSKGAVITGVCTATTFVGALTGNADTATTATSTSGNAGGLTGSPDIAVGQVTAGISTFTGNVLVDGGSSSVNLQFKDTSGAYQRMGIVKDNDKLQLGEYNNAGDTFTYILTVTGNGDKVGIGTDSPSEYIQIHESQNNTRAQITFTNKSTGGTVDDGLNIGLDGSQNAIIHHHENQSIIFGTNDAERFRITGGGGFSLNNGELVERVKITAGKLSDNTNIDLENGNVHHFTTAESTTSTPNIRVSSSTTLNSVMDVGDVTTVTLITTANASAYSEHITIDGSAVTENWVGGSAPSGGGSSGVDIHAFTIIKTAANTYTVIGNHSKTS